MMCSMQISFSLVTLCGIAIIVILRRSYLRYAAKNMKDTIISQLEKDIISALPDDILISIISCMDTKFAVRTSILSKRWRNLYKFVPDDIDFYCQELWRPAHHGASMIYKVERFLRLRSHSIRSFNFRCRLTKSHTKRFEQCIYYLGRLAVEELLVCFSCCRYFPSCRKYSCCRRSSNLSFSCHLLSEMSSLKYFQLALCSLRPSLKLCQYNSLQTLSLMDVKVLPGALECILSNCLMLHSLIIDRCDCPSKLCFCGLNLLLKSLIIKRCKGVKEIELYASNLTKLEFHSPELAKFICNHVPQLQILYLESYSKNIMSYAFEKFAKYLPHLKSLAFCIQDNFDQESTRLMDMGIQTFSNLRRLHLKVYCTPKTNLLAVLILESCPLLQEFNLDIPYNVEYDGGEAQPRKHVVLHSELKKVEISGFEGTKNEIEFPLCIVKSAVYLEQMHIIWSFNLYTDSYIMRDISQRHQMMENQLQGQALSKIAKVIIKYATTCDY